VVGDLKSTFISCMASSATREKVGPEHFGIVSIECAKARFKWMLCDFYGKVLIPPAAANFRNSS